MAAEVVLEVHTLDVTTAHWCAACALPSAIVVQVAIVDARTLRMVDRSAVWSCQDCGVQVAHPVHEPSTT